MEPRDLIGGEWVSIGGDKIRSHNPAHPDETVWRGSPVAAHVDDAVAAARRALPEWSRFPIEKRIAALRAYQEIVKSRVDEIAMLICRETGKALWDSKGEAGILAGKVDITLDEWEWGGRKRVTGFELDLGAGKKGVCSFRPHGVMAVVGPFNFPAHLPNGHIVPALMTGNTIVFKPSDKTPAVGQWLAGAYQEALDSVGAPKGVMNLVHGAAVESVRLTTHADIDGILFTGSWPVGRKILEANLDNPGRIIALELGGNNPALVMDDADLRQTAIECVRAAFVTTGQRCTCTRRVIVHERIADRFIGAISKIASALVIGDPVDGVDGGAAFMGPIIREEAREAVVRFQRDLVAGGGRVVLEAKKIGHPSGGHYVSPGIVRVGRFSLGQDPAHDCGCDMEVFGPILRVSTCGSFEDGLEQVNATRYGLAASVFTKSPEHACAFTGGARAGCVNVNTGTAGASGKLPFGGIGWSGNHRPAGAFSSDYCAYPVASMVVEGGEAPILPGMRFEESWVAE
ncbi:MAG: aldehyde dehydrogenase family protein [Phycisphaerales bacterium]|nr:aldehyde dehydrogenase family protein [Phycisphaerales bacterium]